jgi:hypothetical protein
MCIIALVLGGLVTPVLFEVPALILAAAAAGTLAQRPRVQSTWLSRVLTAAGLLLALFWVGQRTVSEYIRTSGLEEEVAGHLDTARDRYLMAAELDDANPLAQVMAARSLIEIDASRAVEHALRAVAELPIAASYGLLGMAASAAGDEELAQRSWAMAMYLRPEVAEQPGQSE